MANKLNIFLSDNNHLTSFFPSKEKDSKVLTVEEILGLKIINPENRMHFNFFGVENYKTWREVFVPLVQQLLAKSNKFTIGVNLCEQAPTTFQAYFCRENNIALTYNTSSYADIKGMIDTLHIVDVKNFHVNFFVTDSNLSDVDTVLTEFADNQNLDISFNTIGDLSKEGRNAVVSKLETFKNKIVNKEVSLVPSNFAYYSALDIMSMESMDFTKLTDYKRNLYISNELNVYKDSELKDACSSSLLLGNIDNGEIKYRILSKYAQADFTKSCNVNEIIDYINQVNPSKDTDSLNGMASISSDLYSTLKFTKDEDLAKLFDKIKKGIKAVLGNLRTYPESIPYDSII